MSKVSCIKKVENNKLTFIRCPMDHLAVVLVFLEHFFFSKRSLQHAVFLSASVCNASCNDIDYFRKKTPPFPSLSEGIRKIALAACMDQTASGAFMPGKGYIFEEEIPFSPHPQQNELLCISKEIQMFDFKSKSLPITK